MRTRCFALVLLVACTGGPHYTGIDADVDAPSLEGGQPPSPLASCIALPYTCGASGNDNCCNSPEVSGGTYFRSYDLAGDFNSGDQNSPATVSTFRLDKYEVTVGRFRAFVAAGQGTQAHPPAVAEGTHPSIPGSGWEASWSTSLVADTAALVAAIKCPPDVSVDYHTWTDMPGTNENLPMNCISWHEAMAFCAWDGGYLPTESEWNYAAAGGDQQRTYPWSNPSGSLSIDSSHANYTISGMRTDLVAVGIKPDGDGRWGQSDLAGNVAEWTLDTYAKYTSSCTNCTSLTPGEKVIRGGGFRNSNSQLRTTLRNTGGRGYNTGVRCARSR